MFGYIRVCCAEAWEYEYKAVSRVRLPSSSGAVILGLVAWLPGSVDTILETIKD